jgi:1-acyl-sn-glycerol-3-phosphate acyltransferase
MSEMEPPRSVDEIANPLAAAGCALGHDPFDDLATVDPLKERLDQLEIGRRSEAAERSRTRPLAGTRRAAPPSIAARSIARQPTSEDLAEVVPGIGNRRANRSTASESGARRATPRPAKPARRLDNLARLSRRRWSTTPPLAEIELPPVKGWIDRLLSPEQRRIMAAFAHLVEGESLYDRFGYSPESMKSTFLIFHTLYRFYFRVRSEGHDRLPVEGPAVLAGNHGGLLPFDAAMAVIDVALRTDPPRLVRAIVDRWAGSLPWVNLFYARAGQVIGTRENFAKLLQDGHLLLVFPEGIEGMRKTIAHRYRLRDFRVGFIEHALRARAPIVPVAFIGSDDQSPILFDIKPLARKLGLPVAPITPTFPWLGPLGLLPYPVAYRIVYGEPLLYHERFGPEGADDARLVRYLANQVRRAVQLLIDRNRR